MKIRFNDILEIENNLNKAKNSVDKTPYYNTHLDDCLSKFDNLSNYFKSKSADGEFDELVVTIDEYYRYIEPLRKQISKTLSKVFGIVSDIVIYGGTSDNNTVNASYLQTCYSYLDSISNRLEYQKA